MHELDITRGNHLVDPSLHIWGWEISVYLFLGGLVAGMMIISGFFLFRERYRDTRSTSTILPFLSMVLLSAGMLALFFDLEYKTHVWRMYATFQITSPMSWGSWILVLVYPALFLNMLVRQPHWIQVRVPLFERWSEQMHRHPVGIKTVGVVNMLLGALLGIYTGILLSSFGARPLWNSAVLGFLFLVSGLSAAAAFVHTFAPDREERELLAKSDNAFLTIELFVLALFLVGLITSTQVHQAAAMLLISGPYAPVFWVFVVGLGIVIPLLLQSLAVTHRVRHTPVPPLMVIVGGLILRFVIVAAGQASHWTRAAQLW
jgi:formate-dependent nitrite reductase membrane component NrfD